MEELAKYQGSCQLCEGTGVMAWEQPLPGGTGIRTIEMSCPNGCGEYWKHPHAEQDRVIEQPDDTPARARGLADESQEIGADFIRNALNQWGLGPDRK